MRRCQFFLIPVLSCGILLLAGSLNQPAAPLLALRNPDKSSPMLTPLALEPVPMPPERALPPPELLSQAITHFDPNHINWLDMPFRQQVAYEDIHYTMKGRVISGPSQRLHFHLELQLGQETSRVDFFSDGTRVVEIQSLPGQEKKVKKMDLPRIQRPTDDPAAIARDREAALQGKNFKGIGPLLAQIRAGLGDPQLQAVRCQGEELLEIKGKWEVPNDLFNALPKNLRPQVLPRQCRVYLNATTLWPRYVEWWGAGPGGQAKKLLVRTEYGPPIINQPLPPEKLAKTFSPSE